MYSMKGAVLMGKEMETTKVRDEFIEQVKKAFEVYSNAVNILVNEEKLI